MIKAHPAKISGYVMIALISLLLISAGEEPKMMTVMGTLGQVVGIGGETTGWAIKLKSPVKVDGNEVKSLEVDGDKTKFEPLNNKFVEASGSLGVRQGVERGAWTVLEVKEIKESAPD
jgi:hypothetical protein